MAVVNFSIPDKIKRSFYQVFADENKSHVVADLMLRAIRERKEQQERVSAIDELIAIRSKQNPVSANRVKKIRQSLRSS